MLQNTSPTGLSTSSRSLWQRIIRNYDLYLFILPALIWYLVFTYGPLYGVQIAFKNFNGALGLWGSPWIGFKHFRNFLTAYSFPILLRKYHFTSLYSLVAGFPFPHSPGFDAQRAGFKRYKRSTDLTYAPHFISMVYVGMLTLFFSPSMGVFKLHTRSLYVVSLSLS